MYNTILPRIKSVVSCKFIMDTNYIYILTEWNDYSDYFKIIAHSDSLEKVMLKLFRKCIFTHNSFGRMCFHGNDNEMVAAQCKAIEKMPVPENRIVFRQWTDESAGSMNWRILAVDASKGYALISGGEYVDTGVIAESDSPEGLIATMQDNYRAMLIKHSQDAMIPGKESEIISKIESEDDGHCDSMRELRSTTHDDWAVARAFANTDEGLAFWAVIAPRKTY